jgi:hypothetical protein
VLADIDLARHIPQFMRDNKEISCIMLSGSAEFEVLYGEVRRCLDNTFVWSADESGLSRWERLFGISGGDACSDSRVREVLLRLGDGIPYTTNSLNGALTALFGDSGVPRHKLTVDGDAFRVTLMLDLGLEESFAAIQRYVALRIPANMVFEIGLIFQTHKQVGGFTHGALASRTHLQIRRGEGGNEV